MNETPVNGARGVVIVVPCYDERDRLDLRAFESFAHDHLGVAFLFVDDGSGDGTGDLIEERATRAPESLRLLRLDRNRGKAEAVRAGLLEALELDPDVVGFWDADLSTPLEELSTMLRMLRDDPGLRAVIGSRVRLLGRTMERRAVRHYLGRVFATGASLALRMPVYDTQCGAKVFRGEETLRRVLESPFRSRWVFDVELIGRLKEAYGGGHEAWIEERPLRTWTDVGGSKLRILDMAGAAVDLVRIWLDLRRRVS